MNKPATIRILERDNNRRGDLFGRLVSDIFLSLGYDNVRLNVARSGLEIDVIAEHRFENRSAIAECKAVKEKIGGAEVNAFAGKLRTEARKAEAGQSVSAYFISLSGFTETAIDQERDAGEGRIILMNGDQAVHELVKGRILVPHEQAVERCEGAIGIMSAAVELAGFDLPDRLRNAVCTSANALVSLLFSDDPAGQYAGCWALAWMGSLGVWTPPHAPNVIERLFSLWRTPENQEIRSKGSWAFRRMPLIEKKAAELYRSPPAAIAFVASREAFSQCRFGRSAIDSYRRLLSWRAMDRD